MAKKNPTNVNASTGQGAPTAAAPAANTTAAASGVPGGDASQSQQDSQAQDTPSTVGSNDGAQANASQETTAGSTDVAALSTGAESGTPGASAADGAADAAQGEDGQAGSGNAAATDAEVKREYVVGTVPIRHNRRFYQVSHSIYLTDAEAERLSGLVTLIPY